MNSLRIIRQSPEIIKPEDIKAIYVNKFNEESLAKFVESLTLLESSPEIEVIPVYIDSYGGSVHTLIAMVDIIQSCSKPVATIALGKAMSCGALLLASGTKGYRFASPGCDIMIHEVSSISAGKMEDIKVDVKQTIKLNNHIFRLLQEASSQNQKDFFKKACAKRKNTDWYLGAKEFKKLGLIDHIGVPRLVKA
jgi:ATP-dependent Clp protease protease subunit